MVIKRNRTIENGSIIIVSLQSEENIEMKETLKMKDAQELMCASSM